MIRITLYILFCICTVLLVYIGFFRKDIVEKRLEEISKDALDALEDLPDEQKKTKKGTLRFIRIPRQVRNDILASGILLRVEEFVLIWVALVFFPAILFYLFTEDVLTSVCIALVMGILPPIYINMKRMKRLRVFGEQLGDALPLVANGLRSGFSFEQALSAVARDMPDPIAQEMGRACRELALGMSLEQVLGSLTERTENEDMKLLTSAVLIQRKVGGNLADILETVAHTIRERIRLKNHVKTLTAQGRYSGILIGCVPIFLFFAFTAIDPDYMSVFYETTYGHVLLCVAILFEFTAFVVIKKMVTLE